MSIPVAPSSEIFIDDISKKSLIFKGKRLDLIGRYGISIWLDIKEICPVCKHEDTYVIWKGIVDNVSVENEIFLCHECGFFCRKRENEDMVEGITFDSRKIVLKRQINIIRKTLKKNRKILEGLCITDHFRYKPKK